MSQSGGGPRVLGGTWDFKWKPGTILRVAFQKLPSDISAAILDQGKELVLLKLEEWLSGCPDGSCAPPNLDFTVVDDLPAPARPKAGELPTSKSVADGSAIVEYDVLISFQALPVVIPATEQHHEQLVGTSSSELGRYALGVDYGIPSAYLGPQPDFKGDWFKSSEGQFTIVHELGHILGMPHEQQNPRVNGRLPWKSMGDMIKTVRARGGLAPGVSIEDFIGAEVTKPWSGELAFSDWRDPPTAPDWDFASVMAKPTYRCLLKGGHKSGRDCTGKETCEDEVRAVEALTTPTKGDLNHLITMYGPCPEGSAAYDSWSKRVRAQEDAERADATSSPSTNSP